MRSHLVTPLFALILIPFAALSSRSAEATEPLRISASLAYSEPDPEALSIHRNGLVRWTQAAEKLVWYGKLGAQGTLTVRLSVRLPTSATAAYMLKVGSHNLAGKAAGTADNAPVTVDFGSVEIASAGYQRFELQGVDKSSATFGDVDALILSGPAAESAHFNTIPEQRGAPSVHLRYPVPKDAKVEWFYNEVTAKTDPLWSYYMACGWHRGYFGMQVNTPTERRIIFSVWDSGKEAKDRGKVGDDDKVKLLAKGEGVFADSFGNEGTGGHSHLVYNWKTGQTYRFLVSAKPEGDATIYTGYFYFPERRKWDIIARFRAPKDGAYLQSLYSFDEDWNSANGQRKRLAEFGNQWIKTADGAWTELTNAVFTHTGKDARSDYDAGAIGNRFYLAGGGFVDGTIKYRGSLQRPPTGKPPMNIVLP